MLFIRNEKARVEKKQPRLKRRIVGGKVFDQKDEEGRKAKREKYDQMESEKESVSESEDECKRKMMEMPRKIFKKWKNAERKREISQMEIQKKRERERDKKNRREYEDIVGEILSKVKKKKR